MHENVRVDGLLNWYCSAFWQIRAYIVRRWVIVTEKDTVITIRYAIQIPGKLKCGKTTWLVTWKFPHEHIGRFLATAYFFEWWKTNLEPSYFHLYADYSIALGSNNCTQSLKTNEAWNKSLLESWHISFHVRLQSEKKKNCGWSEAGCSSNERGLIHDFIIKLEMRRLRTGVGLKNKGYSKRV